MEKLDNVTGDCILHFITSHRITNIFDQLVTSLMMKWYCISSFETPTETYEAQETWLRLCEEGMEDMEGIEGAENHWRVQNLLMKMYTNCIWNGQNYCNCVSRQEVSRPALVPNLGTSMNVAGTRLTRWHGSHCTVQYSTVQYSTVQYSTVQYSTGRAHLH